MKPLHLLCCLGFTAGAIAGNSSSANYSTATEALDGGGGTASSANYSAVASIGPVERVTASAGIYVERGGFPGQLYELTNALDLLAAAPTLDEGSTLQLSPRVVCSDATLLALNATDVVWSATGPLTV